MITVRTLSGAEFTPELPGRLLKIAGDIRAAGGRAFLVGGWVRDALLGKSCRDYDIEVYDMAQDDLVPLLSKYGRTNLVGKAFGVIHLAMKGLSLDFSSDREQGGLWTPWVRGAYRREAQFQGGGSPQGLYHQCHGHGASGTYALRSLWWHG